MKSTLYLSKLVLLTTILGLSTACQEKLEEVTPQNALNQSLVLSDANAAYTLYYGVYSSFRGFNGTLFTLGEMRSDIWADGLFTESEDPGAKQYNTHNIVASNAPAGNWAGFYSLLDRINTVITLFPQAPIEESRRNQALAEMYGLRAYVYYTLLKTWGPVPLTTETVSQVNALPDLYRERATPEAIMNQIKSDLTQSLSLFGNNNNFSAKRVFWNRAASLTLTGDVYIWSATHFNGGTADLTKAKAALEEVKAISTLGLQANYVDVFDATKENNNKEHIFSISYEKNEATMGVYGNFLVNTTQAGTLIFDAPPGTPASVSSVFPFVGGASRVGMSAATIAKLNDPNDKRARATFRVMYRNAAPYAIAGVMLTKFIGRVDAGAQLYDNDYPIYRYADVLLLLAEAKAKLNEDPSAEINLIRQRAYTNPPAFSNGSLQDNLNAILDEYLREFIGEGKRWWALRRAGNTYVLANIKSSFIAPGQEYKFLLPITVGMLNADPKLAQTPGY